MRLLCEPAAFPAAEVAALGRYGHGTRRSLAAYEAFAHLETADIATPAATLTVVRILNWHYIFDGEQELMLADTPAKVVPRLKAEVTARAIDRHDHILHAHAAAVEHAGRLIVFPAAGGAGKTLLTARLLSLGATYFSDETALLRRDGTMRPIPTALSVKAGGIAALAAAFPGLGALPEHEREDGVMVRYLPPPKSCLPSPARALRPALLVFPRYVPESAVVLRRLTHADALGRLLAECLAIPRRLDVEAVAAIVSMTEQTSCWELIMGDLTEAARQVMRLADDTGVAT